MLSAVNPDACCGSIATPLLLKNSAIVPEVAGQRRRCRAPPRLGGLGCGGLAAGPGWPPAGRAGGDGDGLRHGRRGGCGRGATRVRLRHWPRRTRTRPPIRRLHPRSAPASYGQSCSSDRPSQTVGPPGFPDVGGPLAVPATVTSRNRVRRRWNRAGTNPDRFATQPIPARCRPRATDTLSA